jgi:hypothetical protein
VTTLTDDIDVNFIDANVSEAIDMVIKVERTFRTVVAEMGYHIQVTREPLDERLTLRIQAEFTHDNDTDTMLLDISHTRVQEKLDFSGDAVLTNFDTSVPISIGALNIIALLILVQYVWAVREFSEAQYHEKGGTGWFEAYFDWSSILGFLAHTVSFAACVMYLMVGRDITAAVPPILYVLSAASVLHSLLLIRYLRLKKSTMLIMSVVFRSAWRILQFLCGCLPIFFGFHAIGICFFGHLSELFATGVEMAIILFSSMHGDSLRDLYDSTMVQNDMSVYIGFIYASLWIAFSLLIMFNITIAIVQEALKVETEKAEKAEEEIARRDGLLL